MSFRPLEWAVAGGLAGWAAARQAGADRIPGVDAWAVPVLSFTPQAAGAAWVSALLMRSKGASVTAALAAAALTAAVTPRARSRPQPAATGPVLRVLTANLLVGRADADSLVDLVRKTGADVLFVQELTEDAATELLRAGLSDVLAHQLIEPVKAGPRGSGIYARYPLSSGLAVPRDTVGQSTARLELLSGQAVQLVCVHPPPPKPPSSPHAVTRWRRELSELPRPGQIPVILAGDFNGTLDHAQFRRLLRLGYSDAASQVGNGLVMTWGPEPGTRPTLLAIDHVLVDPRCAVHSSSVHWLPNTDHRAVYAELRLSDSP